jgi:prevent-host-death family protein
MIIHSHLLVMMNRAGVAELKARLSEFLRYVRRGHSVTVYDRDTPIARLVPLDASELISTRPPVGRHASLHDVPLPPPLPLDVDILEVLGEERQSHR